LVLIAEPRVGLRPGRIEPRAWKRRLKSYLLLTKPRRFTQEEFRQNGHPKKQRPAHQLRELDHGCNSLF
jgi:hypothetical protein